MEASEGVEVKGETIVVPVEYYKCLECGAEFEDPASSHDPLALAYKEYRRRHGMLQPEETLSGFKSRASKRTTTLQIKRK